MSWDGMKRRAEDNGGESPDIVLARIDERVKSMNIKLDTHIISFNTHTEDDKKNFGGLYKIAYIGVGILVVVKIFFSH